MVLQVENWHTLIVVCLLAFGIGHAVFRARIGFWTFLLLIVFVSPLLLVYQDAKYYTLILIMLVVGFVYAHRQVVMDIVEDVLDGLRWFTGLFRRKPKQPDQKPHQPQNNYYQQNQQDWQQEQARREQEAREQRQRDKQRKQQRKKPNNYQGDANTKTKHNQQHNQHRSRQSQNNNDQQQKRRSREGQQDQERLHSRRRQQQSDSREVSKTETDTRSPMEILGLQPGFTLQELKAAYKRESARCHPDKWANKPEAIRQMMEQEMKQVNWAYERLK